VARYEIVEKSDDAGRKNIYKLNNVLKLITFTVVDKGVNKTVEWYFNEGQLIYTHKVWTDRVSNAVLSSEKCYLINGQVVAYTINEISMDINSDEFKKVSVELPKYALELIQQEN
jgi:hypothetical protein